MYKCDSFLLEKYNERVQQPSPLIYITRNKTSITTQHFWDKQLITTTIGTRSSVAVRRPYGSLTADMIFTAQVENGSAVIRYAEVISNTKKMKWSVLTTLLNVNELSIMFDGYMIKTDEKVESYTTGDKPYAICVNTDGSLKVVNLNTESQIPITISDVAVNVASVRGLYSPWTGIDDGILIFYTNSLGELWEAQLLNEEIQYVSQILLLPPGVTKWLDCWATTTFDYRILLQLKGDDGKVYSLLSDSRPSGFACVEHVNYNIKVIGEFFAECGYIPPSVLLGYNSSSKPEDVFLEFDGEVFIYSPFIERVWIEGGDNSKRYPIEITKTGTKQLVLTFGPDFVGLPGPHRINYDPLVGGCFGSVDTQSDLNFEIFLIGVDRRYEHVDYLVSVSSPFTAELTKAFDGKMYGIENVGYVVNISSGFSAQLVNVVYTQAYAKEYIDYPITVAQTISGTVTNTSGVPI